MVFTPALPPRPGCRRPWSERSSKTSTARPVPDKIRPLLEFARKLTLTPARMTWQDAQRVFDAGWSEQALHDAIEVVCLFNFMNRLLDGHGVHGGEELFVQRGTQLASGGYQPLLEFLRESAATEERSGNRKDGPI